MDHEYTAIVPELFESDTSMRIGVDKLGGGTVGSSYTGTWTATWHRRGMRSVTSELITGTPKTHEEVAAIAGQFWVSELDTEETWHIHDRVMDWASDVLL